MKLNSLLAALSIATALLLPPLAHAQDDHGHDHGDVAPVATSPALPRFAAVSDAFELVGVLNGKHITLWLDRAADNAPVTDARIEIEVAGEKLEAERHDDVYEVVLAAEPESGVLPIVATVTVGNEVDRLVGELDHHGEAHADVVAAAVPWARYAAWVAGVAAALAIVFVIGRRTAAPRQRRDGDAA